MFPSITRTVRVALIPLDRTRIASPHHPNNEAEGDSRAFHTMAPIGNISLLEAISHAVGDWTCSGFLELSAWLAVSPSSGRRPQDLAKRLEDDDSAPPESSVNPPRSSGASATTNSWASRDARPTSSPENTGYTHAVSADPSSVSSDAIPGLAAAIRERHSFFQPVEWPEVDNFVY